MGRMVCFCFIILNKSDRKESCPGRLRGDVTSHTYRPGDHQLSADVATPSDVRWSHHRNWRVNRIHFFHPFDPTSKGQAVATVGHVGTRAWPDTVTPKGKATVGHVGMRYGTWPDTITPKGKATVGHLGTRYGIWPDTVTSKDDI